MINKEESIQLMNLLCRQSELEHEAKMSVYVEQQEMNLFVSLKPKLYLDGDSWCVLLGENIQEGICGFGDSPMLAIYDFNKSFRKTCKSVIKEEK